MSNDTRQTNWTNTSIKTIISYLIIVISTYLIVAIFGSSIWHNASYFFGNTIQTTMGTLLFIEAGILLALGSLWALGSSENVSYGIYRKNSGGFSSDDWKNRTDQARNPNTAIRIFLIVGALTLITAIVIISI